MLSKNQAPWSSFDWWGSFVQVSQTYQNYYPYNMDHILLRYLVKTWFFKHSLPFKSGWLCHNCHAVVAVACIKTGHLPGGKKRSMRLFGSNACSRVKRRLFRNLGLAWAGEKFGTTRKWNNADTPDGSFPRLEHKYFITYLIIKIKYQIITHIIYRRCLWVGYGQVRGWNRKNYPISIKISGYM